MQRTVDARDDAGLSTGASANDEPLDDPNAPPREDGAEFLFFCPDVTDASTLKRVQQFMDFGYRVTVFSFRRERYNTAYRPPWPNVPLGFTSDARYWHRVRALLCAIPVVFTHRAVLRRAAVFYARNIDQLLLALLARLVTFSRAPVAYEVLDIPPILMRRGLVPTLLRAVERLCLRRTSLLVLSSPGFPSQLLRSRPEISRRLVPAREQAASLDLVAVRAGAGPARGGGRPSLGGRLFRPDPRRRHVRPDHPAGRTSAGSRPVQVRRHPDDRRSGEVRRGSAALPKHRLWRSVSAAAGPRRALSRCRFHLGARPRAHRPQFALVDALSLLRIGILRHPLSRCPRLRSRQHHREASDRLDVRRTARGTR